ncbi:hypothetical protein OX283_009520 [Flavobacterium sp. SUN052]|uniref:hypothetical protein n=1 Tax=Flavobacterium sp. SUN052 TaxID=3002441 RepID=UPI00237D88F8|nr:hypothetical protein [Flavobacterium sp. SUN052]MEC4004893.1 hypothetical protein [Flavobacterium sp. SUN052]
MSQNKLDCTIFLINRLSNCTKDVSYIYGSIDNLSNSDLEYLSTLINSNLVEISNYSDKSSIDFNSINNYLNRTISIEFKIGDVTSYYETSDEFISKNKFQINQQDYFIKELDYRANTSTNNLIENYKTNLRLINFLKEICDNEKSLGLYLKLFFYKAGNGIELEIKYEIEDIKKIKFTISENFTDIFNDLINGSDRKQLFINELINFLDKNGNSYQKLIDGWDILLLNYEKSYSLFLSGFSFDKIKNSSTEYFQDINDRIYDSVSKASNYIFGVPIGYILLLNNFDFNGELILKNFCVLLLGIIFFIMIWCVLFNNVKQSIKAIEKDLVKFLDKINNIVALVQIHKELSDFKTVDLKKQYNKIKLVKILTILIFAIFCFTYTFIFINLSVFFI